MNDIMGLIYTGERDTQLRELTARRAIAAVPLCGRYRLIDFPLSAMTGSGIHNIGVIMQRNYNSLIDHLGSGKEWDLHGKRAGLVILPPFTTHDNIGVYAGFLDALRSNLHFLRRSKQKYVVVTDTHMLFNIKYDEMVKSHIESGADITLLYTNDMRVRHGGRARCLNIDAEGNVVGIEIDAANPTGKATYMEAFCMEREKLIAMADEAVARGMYHFTRDLLVSAINGKTMKLHGFECTGRVWNLDSVQAYFACNMDLLDPEARADLFHEDRPVWTKVRDEMPTRLMPGAKVSGSLIADGCVIEGTVENCVLFRGVRVAANAVVRNSIIMQDGRICSGARVENTILDKQTVITENTCLQGAVSYPLVIPKNTIV